jgi:hypothetical protein
VVALIDDGFTRPALAYLARPHPTLSRDVKEGRLHIMALARLWKPYSYAPGPAGWATLDAEADYWREPTREHAKTYVAASRHLADLARHAQCRKEPPYVPLPVELPAEFGPYEADRLLGRGNDGWVLHGRHMEAGYEVAIKLRPRGDLWGSRLLPAAGHPGILALYDGEGLPEEPLAWVAREMANETLAEYISRHKRRLPRTLAVSIFSTVCEAVAWLLSHRCYRWSAHSRNIYRCGEQWKIGDLGRSMFFVSPDDPYLSDLRIPILAALESDGPEAVQIADWLLAYHWAEPNSAGVFPYHEERERRLRMDQCSMLGGLLVDLLAPGTLWEHFHRALTKRPYAGSVYPITGDRGLDERLSKAINRAWRGEAGGGILAANAGQGEQSMYSDPLELLADVQAVFSK